jgi:hypothetical protein
MYDKCKKLLDEWWEAKMKTDEARTRARLPPHNQEISNDTDIDPYTSEDVEAVMEAEKKVIPLQKKEMELFEKLVNCFHESKEK